mgnify:CR=1 FL=1
MINASKATSIEIYERVINVKSFSSYNVQNYLIETVQDHLLEKDQVFLLPNSIMLNDRCKIADVISSTKFIFAKSQIPSGFVDNCLIAYDCIEVITDKPCIFPLEIVGGRISGFGNATSVTLPEPGSVASQSYFMNIKGKIDSDYVTLIEDNHFIYREPGKHFYSEKESLNVFFKNHLSDESSDDYKQIIVKECEEEDIVLGRIYNSFREAVMDSQYGSNIYVEIGNYLETNKPIIIDGDVNIFISQGANISSTITEDRTYNYIGNVNQIKDNFTANILGLGSFTNYKLACYGYAFNSVLKIKWNISFDEWNSSEFIWWSNIDKANIQGNLVRGINDESTRCFDADNNFNEIVFKIKNIIFHGQLCDLNLNSGNITFKDTNIICNNENQNNFEIAGDLTFDNVSIYANNFPISISGEQVRKVTFKNCYIKIPLTENCFNLSSTCPVLLTAIDTVSTVDLNNSNNADVGSPVTCTFDPTNNTINTSTPQIFFETIKIQFSTTDSLPENINSGQDYFLKRINSTSAQISDTIKKFLNEEYLDILDSGLGTHTFQCITNNFTFAEGNSLEINEDLQIYTKGIEYFKP